MFDTLRRHAPTIVLVVAITLTVASLSWWYVFERTDGLAASLTTSIDSRRAALATLAALTDRNDGDAAANAIARDCATPERARFDTLLSELRESMSPSELAELQSLYYQCGDFYAVRKAVMVTKLQQEFDRYAELLDLRASVLARDEAATADRAAWQALIEAEAQQSALFSALVRYQGDIINALRAGSRASSPTIVTLLQGVQETQERIAVLNLEIDAKRAALTGS